MLAAEGAVAAAEAALTEARIGADSARTVEESESSVALAEAQLAQAEGGVAAAEADLDRANAELARLVKEDVVEAEEAWRKAVDKTDLMTQCEQSGIRFAPPAEFDEPDDQRNPESDNGE